MLRAATLVITNKSLGHPITGCISIKSSIVTYGRPVLPRLTPGLADNVRMKIRCCFLRREEQIQVQFSDEVESIFLRFPNVVSILHQGTRVSEGTFFENGIFDGDVLFLCERRENTTVMPASTSHGPIRLRDILQARRGTHTPVHSLRNLVADAVWRLRRHTAVLPSPNAAAVRALRDMGFTEADSMHALALHEGSVVRAAEYLLERGSQMGLPTTVEAAESYSNPAFLVDPASLSSLVELGFDAVSATRALQQTRNSRVAALATLLLQAGTRGQLEVPASPDIFLSDRDARAALQNPRLLEVLDTISVLPSASFLEDANIGPALLRLYALSRVTTPRRLSGAAAP